MSGGGQFLSLSSKLSGDAPAQNQALEKTGLFPFCCMPRTNGGMQRAQARLKLRTSVQPPSAVCDNSRFHGSGAIISQAQDKVNGTTDGRSNLVKVRTRGFNAVGVGGVIADFPGVAGCARNPRLWDFHHVVVREDADECWMEIRASFFALGVQPTRLR
jgi:hypothetical protein